MISTVKAFDLKMSDTLKCNYSFFDELLTGGKEFGICSNEVVYTSLAGAVAILLLLVVVTAMLVCLCCLARALRRKGRR